MRISKMRLRQIIREQILLEEKEEDIDFDFPEGMAKSIVKKLTDPKNSPAKIAQIDQAIDTSGSVQEKSQAILDKVLDYADMDEKEAKKILSLALQSISKVTKKKK